jgi:hypothetical protein
MKTMALLFATTVATIAGAADATAENATPEALFQFELAQTDSHRRMGVQGYVYNGLPFTASTNSDVIDPRRRHVRGLLPPRPR